MTIVMVNKPQKLNYSILKAYQPIALMECTGKLCKKIVAKWINLDIEAYDLLPMNQFGFWPKHNAIDAATVKATEGLLVWNMGKSLTKQSITHIFS